jgi:hypothetical protein
MVQHRNRSHRYSLVRRRSRAQELSVGDIFVARVGQGQTSCSSSTSSEETYIYILNGAETVRLRISHWFTLIH